MVSPLSRVTLEHKNGLRVVYEDEALEAWYETFMEAMNALMQVQLLEVQANMAQKAAPPPPPERPEVPSNPRTLRSVLMKKD